MPARSDRHKSAAFCSVHTRVLTALGIQDILRSGVIGVPMRFEWDENKNRANLLKHDVRFETAVLAFDDPRALTRRDEGCEEEERWITMGTIAEKAVLLVVHTWFEEANDEVIRIISARAATSRERTIYETEQGTKARPRRHRGEKGRGY